MERLWAPWRMRYVSGAAGREVPDGTCVLCLKWQEQDDTENLLLLRGETCYIMMNLYPYSNGHLMILPVRHIADLAALSEAERLEMFELAQRGKEALTRTMRPDGFNLGMNLGRVAGAGIDDHLHLHLVPRWNGDTNFMPVLGETRVIPEGLSETYRKLNQALEGAGRE